MDPRSEMLGNGLEVGDGDGWADGDELCIRDGALDPENSSEGGEIGGSKRFIVVWL